jgi:hypothetical protein
VFLVLSGLAALIGVAALFFPRLRPAVALAAAE